MPEFERGIIRERIRAGLRRARGKRLGRPPKIYRRDHVLPLPLLQAMVLDVLTLRDPPLAGGGERPRNRERTGSTAGGRR
jgi:hypothetical protein